MDNKFKDLFTMLCYDEPHDCYVIPCLAVQGHKPEVSKEQFAKDIESIWVYCELLQRKYWATSWDANIAILVEVVQEVFYDGNGYAIPFFGVYINEKPENQKITDIVVVPSIVPGRKEQIAVTDFAKDTVMGKFSYELYTNLNQWEQWLKNKKKSFGQQIPEVTQMINEDDYGKKKLAEPFQRKIDEQLNSQK